MKHWSIGVGVVGAAMGMLVHADDTAQQDQQTLDAVNVWATEVRASSVNLDDEAIATKQADHISDLLRVIPGVDVGGAHSLNQRITIRSMDDKDLRITIDGANQNTYMYHHMGNLQINANILKSVDIDVGNNSVVNGGLGGVVRFETKEAKELLKPGQTLGGHVQYTFADNASNSYSVTGFGQLADQVDFLAYYNLIERDNFEVGGGKIKDADGDTVAGTDGTVRGLEGDLDDALLKFGWDISPGQRASISYEAYRDEGDYSYRPDMGLATDLAIVNSTDSPLLFPTEFTRDTLTLNHSLLLGDHTEIKTALFQNTSEFWRDETGLSDSSNGRLRASAGIKRAEAENSGINVLAVSDIHAAVPHQLTYGIDAIQYKTDYREDMVSGSQLTNGEEAASGALFVQDRISVGGGIALIPGIRYEHYDIESTVVEDSYEEVMGAFAAEWQVSHNVLMRASSTQLFKGPELGEAYQRAGANDERNDAIKAETGINNEFAIGFEDSVMGMERFTAGVTLFNTRINDYIYDYAETDVFYGKDNVGTLEIDGYEAYAGVDHGNLSVLLTYASAESELNAFSEYAYLDGTRIDREQGDSISLLADYRVPALDLSFHWDVLMVDDVEDAPDLDGASVNREKEGFTVHNVSARWTPRAVDGLALTLGVDNLFDEYYASQSSRTGVSFHPVFGELYLTDYEPGRNVKATVAYQF